MSVEYLNRVCPPRTNPDGGTGDSLADVPISPPKGRGPAIEGILDHGAGLDGPAAQDGEAAAPGAAVVELAMGQDGGGGGADGAVVLLGPALLEADDVGRRGGCGELAADLGEARGA